MSGLLNEPKWGHLRDLHKAIKLCEPALVSVDPTVTWPGQNLEVRTLNKDVTCEKYLTELLKFFLPFVLILL